MSLKLPSIKSAVQTVSSVKSAVTSATSKVANVATKAKDSFVSATRTNFQNAVAKATNPGDKLNLLGVAKRVGTAAGTVTGAFNTVKGGVQAFKDIRTAIQTRSREDIGKAVDSTLKTVKDGISTTKNALATARDVQKFGSAYRAATAAFRAEIPNAAKGLVRKVGVDVAKSAFANGTRQAVRSAASTATRAFAQTAGTTVAQMTGTASRSAGRALLAGAERAASRAGLTAATRAAGSSLARAAGRFTPGANIAIAAYDTYNAVKTIRDPNASLGKKITSGITAVGSIAAATNIPVVSQIGAGVSTVSSIVGSFFK